VSPYLHPHPHLHQYYPLTALPLGPVLLVHSALPTIPLQSPHPPLSNNISLAVPSHTPTPSPPASCSCCSTPYRSGWGWWVLKNCCRSAFVPVESTAPSSTPRQLFPPSVPRTAQVIAHR